MTALIECRQLERTFSTPAGPVPALKEANLCVERGDMVALMGPSGSGKSTLLHLLGLMDAPTGGTYRLGGYDTAKLSRRERTDRRSRELGFVFQAFHLVEHRNVVENVALPLMYGGIRWRERRVIAAETLDGVGMAHRLEAYPPTLSGGEKQRVAIARAVVLKPRAVLCDEPTGSLDQENAAQVMHILQRTAQAGIAIVIVTHDSFVAEHADRVHALSDGVLGRSRSEARRNS